MNLSSELFSEVRPGFFRVLAGPSGKAYVDVLNALELETAERHIGISRDDATTIVMTVLADHPDFSLEHEEADEHGLEVQLPLREKARRVLDYLTRTDTGWLIEEQLPDWSRVIRVDAHGVVLLDALRKIARPDAVVFTDKLQGVCSILANVASFREEPMVQLRNCLSMAQEGVSELRAIEKSIKKLMDKQRATSSLGEIYGVVFDQYAEQVGRTCYAQLIRARLLTRLDDARKRLYQIQEDDELIHQMQQDLVKTKGLEAPQALASVRKSLDSLMTMIELVQPLADAIDDRTAEFTRRALARSRYLQEVSSKRIEQVQALFAWTNATHSGQRLGSGELPDAFPGFLITAPRLMAGRDSLYEPIQVHDAEEDLPIDDEPTEEERQRAHREVSHALRNALSVNRANAFVDRLPGSKGARIPSTELELTTDEDIKDVMAVLLYAESSDVRYRVEVEEDEVDPGQERFTRARNYRLQRFDVIKK